MDVKYTKHFLNKLEDLMSETDYHLRYEKGQFKSGYCILNDSHIAIVNKFYSLEGKINSLIEIIREIQVNEEKLSDKNKTFYKDIKKTPEVH
ncbi:MAG: hypothetical protein JJU28_24700 [Cyclobacteriaceae bacterium]|nr:hypothetical protein [Cyclobacteriaceae bacterium]